MIADQESLAELVQRVRKKGYVALDTEFVWERTYYPVLSLVQFGLSTTEAYIVDVLAVRDISILGKILADRRITKILHDAQQDLTILRRATGAYARNVFDIRLASGFTGLSSSLSLGVLLKEVLGIKLAKTETRSDWLQRPLTDKQIAYALEDVYYLPDAREKLISRAQKLGHKEWLIEEMTKYDNSVLYQESNLDDHFLKIKGMSKLGRRGKNVLRELAQWREQSARERNVPRSWIVQDQALVGLAQHRPKTISELSEIDGIGKNVLERHGNKIIEAVANGLNHTRHDNTGTNEFQGDKGHLSARVDLALAYLKGKCIAEGIDHALVATRAEITTLVQESNSATDENHRLLRGWRREFIGDDLLKLVSGELAVRMDTESGLPIHVIDSD